MFCCSNFSFLRAPYLSVSITRFSNLCAVTDMPRIIKKGMMSAGTRPTRFIPYSALSAASIGRKRKPQRDKDYYSVEDIEEHTYDEETELRTIRRQSELPRLFEEKDLGYAKWTGQGDFTPGYYLFKLV